MELSRVRITYHARVRYKERFPDQPPLEERISEAYVLKRGSRTRKRIMKAMLERGGWSQAQDLKHDRVVLGIHCDLLLVLKVVEDGFVLVTCYAVDRQPSWKKNTRYRCPDCSGMRVYDYGSQYGCLNGHRWAV
jgi:hypothetical protein